MLTSNELRKLLKENYTSEELCDMLELEPSDIVEAFEEKLEELHDELVSRVAEDTGYGITSDED